LKLEVYLRMRGDAYTLRPTLLANRAPRGKLPWLEDGVTTIPDSSAITAELQRRSDVLDEASVDAATAARAHLVRRTTEESLYFALVAERWRDPAVLARYSSDLLASMPAVARPLVTRVARRQLERQLWQQGYGRHSLPAIHAIAAADLAAIATILDDRPYFTGDRPRAVDASVFGLLANLWHIPIETPLRRAVATHENLVGFIDRMRTRYASDVAAVVPR